jgi:imidazolonepropionase-like amidohydrolase
MRQTGVRLIAGTDAGVPGASFADYVGMLSFFAEIGFTRAEVLDMATLHPAHTLHFHDVGSLRPGYRADIIVVNGDPLSNLEALRDPELVVANGELYQRPAQALRRPSSKSGS